MKGEQNPAERGWLKIIERKRLLEMINRRKKELVSLKNLNHKILFNIVPIFNNVELQNLYYAISYQISQNEEILAWMKEIYESLSDEEFKIEELI